MTFLIGLENNMEGRSMAWALEHPGCFAYGADGSAALSAMPAAVMDYFNWISTHSKNKSWLEEGRGELQVVETWQVYAIDDQFNVVEDGEYEVNAWFQHDWKPLTEGDLQHAVELLAWSRADLLEAVRGLDATALEAAHPGERWNIAGILKHVAGAEWWYLDRLGLAFPRQQVPEEPFQRLQDVRKRLLEGLPSLVGSNQVVGVHGEFWSPRKLVRRAVWHERDHTAHILKLR